MDGPRPRIGAHHGSMSRETRLEAEDALKAGQYDALVATASLELGIDVGAVDLVYQLETPRSVSTGLQRVGRAGHPLDATSKGRILCFERDELLEATAIGRAMLDGELDAVSMPRGCLDVLAQQIVGAVAAAPTSADALYSLFTGADPYTDLPRSRFDAVLGMLAGELPFEMAMPPRPLILWDRATGELTPTRSAAHVAAMNVGTIPESAEYDVVINGTKKRVGSVQSEFVDDGLRTGDVFVLGSTPWKVAGVQRNRLLVEEAPGATPTVPWWHGPVQSRTTEAGRRVGRLRREIAQRVADPDAAAWLQEAYPVSEYGAVALVEYVREQRAVAGMVPDEAHLLVETWPDELGRLNVVIHSPYGRRVNRTWGLAIAAAARHTLGQEWSVTASNDVLLLTRAPLSAAPLHEADGKDLLGLVGADAVEELVAEGSRSSVSFAGAFRDAATRSLQVLRAWQGRRVPLWLQSFRAQELFEAASGHHQYPLMLEVLREHLHEGLDVPAVRELLRAISAGAIAVGFATVQSPSPFAHSLLIQSQYGDDHQMGRSRRAHLLRLHRRVLQEVLSEEEMSQLLDRRAIERLEVGLQRRSEVTQARNAPELAHAIRELGDIPASLEAVQAISQPDALDLLRPLIEARSVVCIVLPECDEAPVRLVAADLWRQYHDAFFGHRRTGRLEVLLPTIGDGGIEGLEALPAAEVVPARWRAKTPQPEARLAIVERYLRTAGPTTAYEIMNRTGWPISLVEGLLGRLVEDGKAQRGTYTSDKPALQWVNRANLEEIHRLTMSYLRRELAACAPYEVVDFTTRWRHLHPSARLHGLDGLRRVVGQLQGLEIVQGALESEVLPGRVADYRPEMLDRLVGSGEVCWRRISPQDLRRGRITLCLRRDMDWLAAGRPLQFDPVAEDGEDIRDVIAQVREHFRAAKVGFFEDLLRDTGLPEGPAMRAVWHLAWTGEISCDTYEAIRHADFQSTLSACYDLGTTPRKIVSGREPAQRVIDRMTRRHLDPRLGRWWATERLVPAARAPEAEEVLRNWAALLLSRWGVVTRDVLDMEVAAPSWAELVVEFKRLELMGRLQRGYFIGSHQGEQYGLPEAIELLGDCRARRPEGTLGCLPDEPVFSITNRDPANLYTTGLDMLDDALEPYRPAVRRGNLVARVALQAGQPLVYGPQVQLVELSREQLTRCLRALQEGYDGRPALSWVTEWNGVPVRESPVAGDLWELGFRFDGRGEMRWPAGHAAATGPPPEPPEVFLPYHRLPPPESGNPELVAGRMAEGLRPTALRLLQLLEGELEARGWEVEWRITGPHATYRKGAMLDTWLARSFVHVHLRTRVLKAPGRREHMHRHFRVAQMDDLDAEGIAAVRRRLDEVQALVDSFREPPTG